MNMIRQQIIAVQPMPQIARPLFFRDLSMYMHLERRAPGVLCVRVGAFYTEDAVALLLSCSSGSDGAFVLDPERMIVDATLTSKH